MHNPHLIIVLLAHVRADVIIVLGRQLLIVLGGGEVLPLAVALAALQKSPS